MAFPGQFATGTMTSWSTISFSITRVNRSTLTNVLGPYQLSGNNTFILANLPSETYCTLHIVHPDLMWVPGTYNSFPQGLIIDGLDTCVPGGKWLLLSLFRALSPTQLQRQRGIAPIDTCSTSTM